MADLDFSTIKSAAGYVAAGLIFLGDIIRRLRHSKKRKMAEASRAPEKATQSAAVPPNDPLDRLREQVAALERSHQEMHQQNLKGREELGKQVSEVRTDVKEILFMLAGRKR